MDLDLTHLWNLNILNLLPITHLTLEGVVFLVRDAELVDVSLSDSSPELGSSETYVLRILLALS